MPKKTTRRTHVILPPSGSVSPEEVERINAYIRAPRGPVAVDVATSSHGDAAPHPSRKPSGSSHVSEITEGPIQYGSAPATEGAVVLPPPERTVPAGPHLRPVTAYQSELITRLNALRSSLWSLVARVSVDQPERSVVNTFRDLAADFSMASARAWMANGFAGLAGEVHALEVKLEGIQPPAPDEWADARRLAFDLAVEAGRIDHARADTPRAGGCS